ncbi:hypothetical protein INT45_012562 [Circinella minor]|uniref:C2H2-type domain-containing protein n=1 Tax=Circinella minor TaxID=1195481 RepID=A0A8H7S1Z6_9FUNG|nr:hypothetical protein INT45_012562 [Circinella minor]
MTTNESNIYFNNCHLGHWLTYPQSFKRYRRYGNDTYYVKATNIHDVMKHFGCPVCIAHFMKIDDLKTHYYTNHLKSLPEQAQTIQQQQNTNSQDQTNKGHSAKSNEL